MSAPTLKGKKIINLRAEIWKAITNSPAAKKMAREIQRDFYKKMSSPLK